MTSAHAPHDALLLLGSPGATSRSASLARQALALLQARGWRTCTLTLRDLPADDLLGGRADASALREALDQVAAARLVLVATPIYKAAYSGLLKAFLDLLPQDGLRGKVVWPLATGGSPAHLLALDYALKPVLGAPGARHLLDSVYATDAQLTPLAQGGHWLDDALTARLQEALRPLLDGATADHPHAATPADAAVARPWPGQPALVHA